ncbi:MAG: hypothetical protein KDJ28_11725 [Candidatus Competibacteraceae bacterium]|nr:hypothetical protein [Candidatus Competibacteraceae bacterium]
MKKSGAIAIATGRTHSLAVTQDGTVWAWGQNDTGQRAPRLSGRR